METSDVFWPNLGKRCACRAVAGSCGSGSSPVCVEEIVELSGSSTMIGMGAGVTFSSGALIVKKCPELPVSRTAV